MIQEVVSWREETVDKEFISLSKGQRAYLKVKRLLDVMSALIGMLLFLPIGIAIAIAIKLEDPSGKIIYSQERIGRTGVPFQILKFRSMREDAPELSTQEFLDSYQYVTRVGRFIRKTSLDELPQLWNVLIGQMSLIGPRPLLPRERDVHIRRFYSGVYQIRPGITGTAQTHGRDKMADKDKVYWDRSYVKQLSFLTDLRLFFITIHQVLRHDGVTEGVSSYNQEGTAVQTEVTRVDCVDLNRLCSKVTEHK